MAYCMPNSLQLKNCVVLSLVCLSAAESTTREKDRRQPLPMPTPQPLLMPPRLECTKRVDDDCSDCGDFANCSISYGTGSLLCCRSFCEINPNLKEGLGWSNFGPFYNSSGSACRKEMSCCASFNSFWEDFEPDWTGRNKVQGPNNEKYCIGFASSSETGDEVDWAEFNLEMPPTTSTSTPTTSTSTSTALLRPLANGAQNAHSKCWFTLCIAAVYLILGKIEA